LSNNKKIFHPNKIKEKFQTAKWSHSQWKLARVLQLKVLMRSPGNLSGMLEPCFVIGITPKCKEFFLNLNVYSPIILSFQLFPGGKKIKHTFLYVLI